MIFLRILMVLMGLGIAFLAYKDSDIVLNARRARFIVTILGRKGARIFYIIVGIVYALCWIFLDIP